jgi:hypothetical protein
MPDVPYMLYKAVMRQTKYCVLNRQQKQLKAHQQKIEYAETISEYISQPS